MNYPNPFETESLPLVEPEGFAVGQFVRWSRLYDLDRSLYDLRYVMRSGVTTKTVLGVFTSDRWVFEIGAVESATWAAGSWSWELTIRRLTDSQLAPVDTGYLDVFAVGADRRSHAQIMVTKINSILQGRADADVASYTIKDRSITKMTPQELITWRDYYLNELRGENKSQSKTNTVVVRFKP